MRRGVMAQALAAGLIWTGAAQALTVNEAYRCVFPDACHENLCLTEATPLVLLFVTTDDGTDASVLLTASGMLIGTPPSALGDTMRNLQVMRQPDTMPIRSLSLTSTGGGLISLWTADGVSSATYGGSCRSEPVEKYQAAS